MTKLLVILQSHSPVTVPDLPCTCYIVNLCFRVNWIITFYQIFLLIVCYQVPVLLYIVISVQHLLSPDLSCVTLHKELCNHLLQDISLSLLL